MALFTRFLGRTASEGAAFALGAATAPVLAPPLEDLKNEAWRTYPSRTVGPNDAAEIVAEDVQLRAWGANEASAHGIDGSRFDALIGAVLNAPGFADLLTLRRRGLISQADFDHGLRKSRLETLWDSALAGLEDVLLSVADLANAVVQGHMTQAAAAAEAAQHGVDATRFDVLVQNTGLPPGPETLLAWRRRDIIDDAELDQGIREGHTKTKYIPFFHAALQPVLSHTTYAGLRLRGWLTKTQADAGGALTGYTPAQMDLEYLNRGRPATTHQVHIGFTRGGRLIGFNLTERQTFDMAIQQSDIRPEWADILWAARYNYPSAFVLRALVQAGDITQVEGEQALLFSGWEPTFAAKVAAAWAQPSTGATVNPRVKRAQDQVYNATHSSYMNEEIDRPQALSTLAQIGVPQAAAAQVVDLWDVENSVLIKPLAPAAVKKAYKANTFALDVAIARLVDQQWTAADAQTYLTT